MKNLYFFTSFGRLDQLPAGGGQTASRRLWHTLEEEGFNVEIFNRHRYYWYKGIVKVFLINLWIILDPIWFFFKLVTRSRKDSAVLFMTYAGGLLPFDFAITMSAVLSGHRRIMYLAGGQAKYGYETGGRLYKWLFRKTMSLYDEIMCEGEINVDLIREVTDGKVKAYYLPNFTENGFAPETYPAKPEGCNLLYFGRVSPTKEVLLGIDVFNKLADKYSDMKYTIIGSGPEDYEKQVADAIDVSPFKERITRYPQSSHDFIAEQIKLHHIFLFPSHEPCEGHSNALNEAMSWGMVPVVSDNNFLPSIVGDDSVVAHDFIAESYVDIISGIIDEERFPELSQKMYRRVKERFVQSVVGKELKKELEVF